MTGHRRMKAVLAGWVALALLLTAIPVRAGAPEVHREVLDNGLVLQVVSRPALPILSMELGLRAGARNDPAARPGLANLVGTLLTYGTETRSATEISEQIEFVGGSIAAGVERDFATVTVSVLSRDAKLGMELLSDVVRRPAFADEEVARVRDEVVGVIAAEEDNLGRVAGKAFDRALFGDHPYARPVEGDADSVPAIGADQIRAFHQRYYRADNAVLSFVGDITPRQARKLTRKAFGDWAAGSGAAPETPPASAPKGTRIHRIDRAAAQANVVMGHLGIRRANPDFYPVVVMNYILGGGGFTSRLVDSVRDRQGLAYSIYSGFSPKTDPGEFSIRFQTRNATAQQAIDSALAEVRRIRTEPVTETELAEAKSYLTGSFPLRLDTNRKTARLLTFIHMYGLGESYFSDYLERVAQVTVADVLRVARRYLHPEDMVWVVVANPEEAQVAAP